MEGVAITLLTFVLLVLMSVVAVAVVVAAAFVCMTVWALVKPILSPLIDAWMEWFERRTEC